MRIGPFHLLKDSTLKDIQSHLDAMGGELEAYHAPGFTHYPLNASMAPAVALDPDEPSPRAEEAVKRIIAAFRSAREESVEPARSMWEEIERDNEPFVKALTDGDAAELQPMLARMFQTDLVWGLGRLEKEISQAIRDEGEHRHYQRLLTDALVSLAQATSVLPVTLLDQQGIEAHQRALDVDLERTLEKIEKGAGLDPAFPSVGAAYGCRIGEKLVSIDSLLHSYAIHRLRQLGATPDSTIVELGGGYGCLAMLARRAGFNRFDIYDLPWVNAIQGYFLLMSHPPGEVSLCGEPGGPIGVHPHWRLSEIPDRSVDVFISQNAMAEMGLETVRDYLAQIKRVTKGYFLSIGQEGRAEFKGYGAQHWLSQLIGEAGGFDRISRSPSWMAQGYVEEVYRDFGSASD